MLALTVILCIAAVLTKVVGCGLGAAVCHYSKEQCIRIGCGMISRGEVALIVANKGMALNLLPQIFITPVLLSVVFSTIITPILLKVVYKHGDNDPDFNVQNA